VNRPPFETALQEWRRRLQAAAAPTEIRWAFHENLCVQSRSGRHHLLYQLQHPAITEPDVARVYESIAPHAECVVFRRLFSHERISLCALASDPWESEDEDFDEQWSLYFSTNGAYESHSEIVNPWEWRWRRLQAMGVLSGVDFMVSYRENRCRPGRRQPKCD
jgi:hypothetical protein